MDTTTSRTRRKGGTRRKGATSPWGAHDGTVLVLQGGGALGAYQAGAFAALAEGGIEPDWVAGVSIGAINAALIVGNPPQMRVERITEFWHRLSEVAPLALPVGFEALRPMMNQVSAATAFVFGVPGFFTPRPVPPLFAADGRIEALSVYDTTPLKATLEELVDFDLINGGKVRLSLGAVNVRTAASVYFDSTKVRIGPEHVMASGALPPGFPPVEIDGEFYWDGGIVSNSPLSYVADEGGRGSALVFQVDVFSGIGPLPENLGHAAERVKDIQFASKQRFNADRLRQMASMREALARVLDKLPKKLQDDPDVKALRAISTRGKVSLIHVINRHAVRSSQFKDCEFSRATVSELWSAGKADLRRALTDTSSLRMTEIGRNLRIYEFTK